MVIINVGCRGHAGDSAAAWPPEPILHTEFTFFAHCFSYAPLGAEGCLNSREGDDCASRYSFSVLFSHGSSQSVSRVSLSGHLVSPPTVSGIGQLTGSHGAWGCQYLKAVRVERLRSQRHSLSAQ